MSNESKYTTVFDLIIVGGGMVGAALARALHPLSLKIAVIENTSPQVIIQDKRAIVLSYGSSVILQALGLWSHLKSHTVPIRHLQLSDAGQFGMANLSARDEKVDALGYVIEGGVLLGILQQSLAALSDVAYYRPANVVGMTPCEEGWQLDVVQNQQQRLRARCVVAADGTHSTIRKLQQVATTTFDYQQTAIISTVGLNRPHHHVAYERFTPAGAIAFLPQSGLHSGLVWSAPHALAEELFALSDAAFLKKLQQQFGYRLGRFVEVAPRIAYPLKQMQSVQQAGPGWVLIGNAAHTLHPIAAQGFNLGLRDVACLTEVLQTAVQQQQDLSSETITQRYVQLRQRDHQQTIAFTHRLVRVFSHDIWPIKLGRSLATTAVEYIPLLKHRIARQAMGLQQHPR